MQATPVVSTEGRWRENNDSLVPVVEASTTFAPLASVVLDPPAPIVEFNTGTGVALVEETAGAGVAMEGEKED